MFERYTERARRVIFFARKEASEFGAGAIQSEHLLLGLVMEDSPMVEGVAHGLLSIQLIRDDVRKRVTIGEKLPVSVDLPLANECKRILAYAAEEAERLHHSHISTEHLLLGMLRETDTIAAEILRMYGIDLAATRVKIALAQTAQIPPHLPKAGCVPDPETAKRIAEAVWLVMYGEAAVEEQKPFQADFENDLWTVKGLPRSGQETKPFVAVMSRVDGRIVKVGTTAVRRELLE
jgi:ATP-dependent Clp protease ATP-binding subunit ClpA